MRIAVVGAGAMGSVYAGLLGAAGNEVWAMDLSEEHVAAIREHGIRVEGASGDRIVRIGATTNPDEIGIVDLVVIATKAMHVRGAALSARSLVGPDTIVLPIQNGLGSADVAADVLGEGCVAIGVAGGFGASLVAPGHAHHHGYELIRLGERRGPVTERIERIAAVWRAAGFAVQTDDDVDRLVWEKLICNVCFSGTCTVLGLTLGEVMADPNAWHVATRCAVEAYDVALAAGIALRFDDPVEHVAAFGRRMPGARPSMLLDRIAGRPSEIDAINGAIPPRAAALGLAAPCNETITALVKALEAQGMTTSPIVARDTIEARRTSQGGTGMATTAATWTREALARAPQTYFDAVDAMDVDAVLDHFADDATLTVQTDHVTFAGAAEIRRMFTDFFGASKTIRHEIRNIVVEEAAGKVATEQGYIGELRDGSLNDMHNCNFFDFDADGKFKRVIIWMAGSNPLH